MKVKLLNQYCGPRGSFAPGHVINVPLDEASQLIAGGYAEAAEAQSRQVEADEAPPQQELDAGVDADAATDIVPADNAPAPPLKSKTKRGKGKGGKK